MYRYGYSIVDIANKLQKGAGRSVTKSTPIYGGVRAQEIRDAFLSYGWDSQYVSAMFRNLTERMAMKYPVRRFLAAWAHNAIHNMNDVSNLTTCLEQLGLRKEIVTYLITIITPLENTSYSNIQLLDVAIEHLLKETHPRIDSVQNGFFLNSGVRNTWYTLQEDNRSYINIRGPCIRQRIAEIETIISHCPSKPRENPKLFYHTSSWSSCVKILRRLSRIAGRHCTDFGVTPSFYISETVTDCVGWGERNVGNYSGQVGIVIFSLPRILPASFTVCELNGTKWNTVTKLSRKCLDEQQELEDLWNCHFVYGDMVSNPGPVMNGAEPRTHTPPKKQLASKTDEADRYLHSCIVGCLFFEEQR